jgi:hypothetical protein
MGEAAIPSTAAEAFSVAASEQTALGGLDHERIGTRGALPERPATLAGD